jgi:translation initiation factor IF-3
MKKWSSPLPPTSFFSELVKKKSAAFLSSFLRISQEFATKRKGTFISTAEPRINDRIRVPEVRLIGAVGEQVGVVAIDVALRLAEEAGYDLVEIAPDAQPPVCKIMDFGKYKYEIAQKAREARQNQTHIVVKEIRLGLKIENHDYETKKNHIEKFLLSGDKVKVTVQFKGREQTRPEMGFRLLQRLAEDVASTGFVEFAPKREGRSMTMVLGPLKKKSEAVAEAKRRAAAVKSEKK